MLEEQQLPVYFTNIDTTNNALTAVFTTVILKDGVEITRIVDNRNYDSTNFAELQGLLPVDSDEAAYLTKVVNRV
jgi:hypothetical protein